MKTIPLHYLIWSDLAKNDNKLSLGFFPWLSKKFVKNDL